MTGTLPMSVLFLQPHVTIVTGFSNIFLVLFFSFKFYFLLWLSLLYLFICLFIFYIRVLRIYTYMPEEGIGSHDKSDVSHHVIAGN